MNENSQSMLNDLKAGFAIAIKMYETQGNVAGLMITVDTITMLLPTIEANSEGREFKDAVKKIFNAEIGPYLEIIPKVNYGVYTDLKELSLHFTDE